ncbi:unnamed protein product [Paramecium sonneborni]|uniref:Zinc-finger domain-containing protein n=1 Tax=Paramecium sonneborni TaxID=65129 RepID=A0A8S1LQL8_9CILI|nr:unnamed protein product [Paramecium sonneborni]
MDKSVESHFTSDFWRQVNQQYFMVETPISLNMQKKIHKKSSHFVSIQTYGLIEKILKFIKKHTYQVEKLNDSNIRLHLSLLLMQREKSFEPFQELIDEMIDNICEQELREGLESNKVLLKNIHQLPYEKQMEILQSEESILQSLQQRIDWPDQLNQVIMEIEDDLIKVQDRNKKQLNNLAGHLEEINKYLLYQYNIKQIGQFALRISRNRIQHQKFELENLQQLIIHYQDYQVADSIGKVFYNQKTKFMTVTLDSYLSRTPMDFKIDQLQNLQRLREKELDLNFQQQDIQEEIQTLIQIQTEMCHSCRQMIEITNLQQCKQNHRNMNFHNYNEELLIQQRYSISQQQMRKFYIDLYSANYIIENNQIQCQKYFCFKCLKYEFDQYDISEPKWICPLCKGICFCIRCQRNDCIYKLKRAFIEIGGNLDTLYSQSTFDTLVENKRILIQTIPFDFIKILKIQSENEKTFTQKNLRQKKNRINKKKKSSETILVGNTQSQFMYISSSSIKIKKIKEYKRPIPNESTIFVQ